MRSGLVYTTVPASGLAVFADLPAAAAAMVHPGGRIVADVDAQGFHAAKYRLFLQLYADQQRHQAAMASAG